MGVLGGLVMTILACFFFGFIGGKIGHIIMGIIFLLCLLVALAFRFLVLAN